MHMSTLEQSQRLCLMVYAQDTTIPGAEVQGYSLAVRWYRAWRVHATHASKLTCHERHPTFLLLRLIIRPAPICQAVTVTFCTSATASGSCLMGCGHAWGSCIAWIAEYGGLAHSPWACPRMSPVSFFRQLGNDHGSVGGRA